MLKLTKANGDLPSDFKSQMLVILQPTKNEYQNFISMQAQDEIETALLLRQSAA
ncbi:MAG: DUF2920 family protein [Campylobacter sp.]|uniref:DUF2920 family protein n=1 Tax=Campylobacter sp. TaxID=205 RepID=UPI00362459F2